ncbi:MAG: NAD-dependent malic enzyme [Desulfovibrionaceae bacterium]|nr:NAD-dependent malic enzyme [Desulfovibrionaceae bacterium]
MSKITNLREDALQFHREHTGKIEIRVKVSTAETDDLTLAYSPGVAEPCMEIYRDPSTLDLYTNHANSVCVVSDGTAVLGLGNIGPCAAMPVMEGKALLFKKFGDVDAFPICVNTNDVDKIIEFVELLAPTFGGVNLEDIKAPQCFEIEDTLKARGIFQGPIFHDDQHGTAIVTLAGVLNALKIVGKDINNIKVVTSGAGAAGTAIIKLLMACGLKNVIMCDSIGAIWDGRPKGMNKYKAMIAKATNPDKLQGTLADAIKGADVFIGVSVPNSLTEDMIRSMNNQPIVFAQANPTPEIWPIQRAIDAGAKVVATGRSDVKNQINNVLVFPGLFRGAIDVRATEINDAMKIAVAHAIADLVTSDQLCPDYIIPSSLDENVAPAVAAAAAKAAIETGVARNPIDPKVVAENLRKRLRQQK